MSRLLLVVACLAAILALCGSGIIVASDTPDNWPDNDSDLSRSDVDFAPAALGLDLVANVGRANLPPYSDRGTPLDLPQTRIQRPHAVPGFYDRSPPVA